MPPNRSKRSGRRWRMSRLSLRGRLKANAVVLVRFLNSPSTRKDNSVPPGMNLGSKILPAPAPAPFRARCLRSRLGSLMLGFPNAEASSRGAEVAWSGTSRAPSTIGARAACPFANPWPARPQIRAQASPNPLGIHAAIWLVRPSSMICQFLHTHSVFQEKRVYPGCVSPLFNDRFVEQLLTPHVIGQNC